MGQCGFKRGEDEGGEINPIPYILRWSENGAFRSCEVNVNGRQKYLRKTKFFSKFVKKKYNARV
jgi:hypothetical protein